MLNLQGKVAVITGATKGIGKATVEKLAKFGAKVAICGRDENNGLALEAYIKGNGGDALFIECDLLDRSAPHFIVESTVARWQTIDIVVNNAAMVCHKPLEKVTHEDWNQLFEVNLKSPFFTVQAALPWLRESKGMVINVSSMGAWINSTNNLVYDTMKAALNHMTRGLAMELRKEGVRFNALMPGGTLTPLLDQWLDLVRDTGQAIETSEQLSTDPDIARPDQIADAIILLASDLASWITGAAIPLDGGVHLGE